ncbi:MAG TPA: protein kinase [Kofleriaceae bacterium]
MSSEALQLDPGTILAGRFEIEAHARSGGMGAVYRAIDRTTATPVAIKVMRNREGGTRFTREVELLAALDHPAIVRYVAHGEHDGDLFLAMEWLDGEDLAHRLAREPLPDADSHELVRVIAGALAAAHERGLVHRDVKPSNIFLVGGDPRAVKLLDFGIARSVDSASLLTHSGALVGTPLYMSAEQARGDKNVDVRTDVFSLGCVWFECLTGSRVRAGNENSALAQAILDDAPRASSRRADLDRRIDFLLARMLSRDRNVRPADGRALELELARLAAGGEPSIPDVIVGGERRLRTVVVVDLAGQETLSAVRSAEIERWAADANAHVDRLGESMLVASLPIGATPREQATLAARLALRVRDSAPSSRIALATARAASGLQPASELVLGAIDLFGTTSNIVVDAMTADLVGERFALERTPDHRVVLREEVAGGALLGRAAACVGREQELARLEGLLAECVAESRAAGTFVVAGPGGGKTRLCEELVARVGQRYPRLRIITASARVESAGAPFALLAPVVAQLVELRAGAPADVVRARLRAWAEQECDPAEVARVAGALGEILGVPREAIELDAALRDAQLMSDLVRDAWRRLVARETGRVATLLVLDDIQWSDAISLDLLALALRDCAAHPLAIVVAGRPEAAGSFPGLGSLAELPLQPLAARAAERLVREMLDQADGDVVQRIVDRAGGNPLYLEELIRATSMGAGDVFPATVLAAVQARLDAHGADHKRFLRAASVFGERFWLGAVELIAPGVAASVADDLIRAELVAQVAHSTLPGQRELRFRHALVREAAYALWPDDDLETAHRLAAQWLEAAGEQTALVLAEHYRKGHHDARAALWFRVAAEHALRVGDLAGAIAWCTNASEHLDAAHADDAAGAHVDLLRTEAHFLRGEVRAAEELSARVLARLPEASDDWLRAIALGLTAAGQQGANDRVRLAAERLLAMPASAAIASRAIEILARAITQLEIAGDRATVDRAWATIKRYETFGSMDVLARVWMARARASAQFIRGEFNDLDGELSIVVEGLESVGDLRNVAFARILRANAHLAVGEYAAAEQEARRATAAAERVGAGYFITWSHLALGKVFACRADLPRARIELGIVIEASAASPRVTAGAHMYLSFAAFEIEAYEVACAEAERALALKISPPARASALALRARAQLRRGELPAALAAADEAIGVVASLGSVEEFDILVRLAYAEALNAAGKLDEARAASTAARDLVLARANKLTDPVRRDSFLTQRSENVATLRLAQALASSG